MTAKEIAKEANASVRVVRKWLNEKHKITNVNTRLSDVSLSELQYHILIGSLLGDGHIDKRDKYPIFIVSHAENQKDYLYWKYEVFKNLCNKPPSQIKASIKIFNGKEYSSQIAHRLVTRSYNCFRAYRGLPKFEYLERLSDISFSIWILDDGYRGDSNWSLCVAEYTEKDKNIAIDILTNKFGLKCWYDKTGLYMYFNSESSKQIDKIILKNIPNHLDIVRYKIIENSKIKRCMDRVYYKDLLLTDYCANNNIDYKKL